jgi:hypothetical protein
MIVFYKPLPPPGLLPLNIQEIVLSIFFNLFAAYLALLFILFLSLLKVFMDTSLYFLSVIIIRLFSVVNADDDLKEHEQDDISEHEHEHNDLSETEVLLKYVLSSTFSKNIFSLTLK